MQPFMGTGWAANVGPRGKPGDQQPPPQYQQYPAPPQYTPGGGYYQPDPNQQQQQQQYFPQNNYNNYNQAQGQGPTSPQQTGIELQQPPNAYRGESVYAPPPGPPPQKTS